MGKIVLVTGGARSGKSTFAEQLFMRLSPNGGIYAATAEAHDEEMMERIRLHRASREASDYGWATVNQPLDLPTWLSQAEQPAVLVDCLTIWLSNELLRAEQEDEAHMEEQLESCIRSMQQVLHTIQGREGIVVMVTNEVGSGVVPAYKLGRIFRDAAGRLNQRMAALADEVYLVTAGIPIELKSRMVEL
ncbi:bifunctional adenosylcobinamide kinase/adenosylcobinamide-phosphate guanylyltransferase [Paenibacillus sp. B1-33]|uniref:bifunctional adenosylcobinamide kinase/adenosylcobinamide-phosphate guanylyltransferase n=1 Tax=unclassified Paenibacillus TaxID=185978 RepID=UPI003D270F0B